MPDKIEAEIERADGAFERASAREKRRLRLVLDFALLPDFPVRPEPWMAKAVAIRDNEKFKAMMRRRRR